MCLTLAALDWKSGLIPGLAHARPVSGRGDAAFCSTQPEGTGVIGVSYASVTGWSSGQRLPGEGLGTAGAEFL